MLAQRLYEGVDLLNEARWPDHLHADRLVRSSNDALDQVREHSGSVTVGSTAS